MTIPEARGVRFTDGLLPKALILTLIIILILNIEDFWLPRASRRNPPGACANWPLAVRVAP